VDAYAIAVDDRDGEAFASLFTADAVLVVVDADGAERHRAAGRAAISAVPAGLARYDRTFHAVTTHHWVVDGDEARGVAYCEAHHLRAALDEVLFVRYDDHYVRSPDGWRFTVRTVNRLWVEHRQRGETRGG
jgi:ketosteroid isomerase-like protein